MIVLTIKKIALGACLLVSSTALAQDRTYTVKEGDTLSEIATKFGTNSKAILHANSLPSADKLKLGQTLRIPAGEADSKTKSTPKLIQGSVYNVRAGDNDESIAKKLGITAKQLRVANMGTNWTRLQIGQALVVPTTKAWFDAMAHQTIGAAKANPVVAKAPVQQPEARLVSSITSAEAAKPKIVQRTYTVRNGDNDWIIAKRVGIKPSILRSLNPSVKWSNLQIGTTLKVPGTKTVAPSGQVVAERQPNLPRIRSRYAVIVGDAVTVRRGPSVRFDQVTRVDSGTRVLVLDRDGSWYKLRFPKGTEAWVRGDFLAPTKAPQIYAAKTERSKKSTHKSQVLVASKTTRSNPKSNREATRNARRPARDSGRVLVTGSMAGDNAVERARSMLGVRYRYGAASRGATDCSGLTSQVYKSLGVKLPRTARQQSTVGQKVDKSGLQPGDLVFFKTRGSGVSHAGIYKGNGVFIHASSGKGRVMESSLNEGYYNRRFAGARRVAGKSKKAPTKVAAKPETKPVATEPVSTPVDPTPPDNGTAGDGGK
jgi:cell wall-associated NlpC family hydrolase